jgi:tetratricopeptide (TPR) repeat protein
MPGHIYLRTGDFEAAAKSNEVAAAVDRTFIQTTGANGMYPVMYYSHNLHFIAYSRSEQGRYAEAIQAARAIAANVKPVLNDMPMAQAMASVPYFVMARSQRWDELLMAPDPGAKLPVLQTFWHFARGVAFAGKKDAAKARTEAEAFAALAKSIPAQTQYGNNTIAKVLAVAEPSLRARIAEASGEQTAAIEAWRDAVRAEDALLYDEPPAWYYPVRESLGAALYRNKQFAEAETVFRECLNRVPRSPRSLFGLVESLKAQGKSVAVAQVQPQLNEVWKLAQIKLSMDSL